MKYYQILLNGTIIGTTIYGIKHHPITAKAWMFTFAPYIMRKLYDVLVKKYPNIENNTSKQYIENIFVGVSVYSLYKSSIYFDELAKITVSNTFINYIGHTVFKKMTMYQFSRLLLMLGGTGITYIFIKYLEHRIINLINIATPRINQWINPAIDVINRLEFAIANNQNYNVNVGGISIIGKSTNIHSITEKQLEENAPLRFPNKNNVSNDFYETDNCSICCETFDSKEMHRVLPCKHAFHAHCVDNSLLTINPSCPLCKQCLLKPSDINSN